MPSDTVLRTIKEGIVEIRKVEIDKIIRKGLGDESIEKEFTPRHEKIEQLLSLTDQFASYVNDETLNGILTSLKEIHTQLKTQAGRNSAEFLGQKQAFLASIDNQLEQVKKWTPALVCAAIVERGYLKDEGIRQEYERTLEKLRTETASTLLSVKKEAENAVKGAKELADQIEARARMTASGISVVAAQVQFEKSAKRLQTKVKFWGRMVALSLVLVVGAAGVFMLWPLPKIASTVAQGPSASTPAVVSWPDSIYHTVLRVVVLSAIAGFATFCIKMYRAHLHMKEMNEHRLSVANSVESFVNSATDVSQRDLILAKLVESIVHFGDSGIVKSERDESSSTLPADFIGRILTSIAAKK